MGATMLTLTRTAAVLHLDDEACRNAARVGAKAANLSALAGVHRIPPGFVLTAEAVEACRGNLDRDLTGAVLGAYEQLLGGQDPLECAVAVRSSAIGEDGAEASFAGQHETYLNIRGKTHLLDAIERCLESARNQRALAYRRQHGIDEAGVPMAVFVQRLVRADIAGVIFSANPISGARDEVMINASWGLGESIVGGTVTPDTFVVSRKTGAITERRVATKLRMTICSEDGTVEAPVPRFLQGVACLDDGMIGEMTRLAEKLEAVMGWPVDVECCVADGQLHLLQCRPITGLV